MTCPRRWKHHFRTEEAAARRLERIRDRGFLYADDMRSGECECGGWILVGPHRPACPTPDKAAHRSEEKAQRALDDVREVFGRGEDDYRLHVYECSCRRWHVGRRSLKWLRFHSTSLVTAQ